MSGEAAGLSTAKPGGGEAVVVFSTKLPATYQVPEDQLVLPSNLARYGLSEVVNRLLSLEKPVPFDFLVDGEFLRSTVGEYLEARKLSAEKVLHLEYVLALSEPEPSEVDQVPDWISGVVALQPLPSRWFAAVSYDGTLRLYDSSRPRLTVRLAEGALSAVAADPTESGRESRILAAAKDGSVRCCALTLGGEGGGKDKAGGVVAAGAVGTLKSPDHSRAMEAVAFSEDGSLVAAGGWDQDVFVWNSEPEHFPAPTSASAATKRKAAGSEASAPKFVLKGHSQVVTCLHFGARARYPYTLISASWDSTVRVWDTAAASCVANWPVARAVTSLSTSPAMPPQLATGHEDGHVSLWDIRAAPHPSVSGAVLLDSSASLPLLSAQVPHRRLTSEVLWCPEDVTRIASVGHDGRLCILDTRSPKMPLQCLRVGKPGPNPTKLLCAAWLARDMLAIGGSDGKVIRVMVGQPALPGADSEAAS